MVRLIIAATLVIGAVIKVITSASIVGGVGIAIIAIVVTYIVVDPS